MKIQPLLVYFYNMKNHIYVARSHENDLLDGDALPVLIPILNGAANSSLKNPKGLRDDNGPESMSGKATTFRWLTSLYWIWKNETITDTSIVGFYSEDKMLLDNFTTRTATEINYLNEAGNPNKEIRYSKSLIADCKDRILSDLKSLRFSLYDAVTPRPQFDLPVLSVRDCWNFFHDEELLKQAEEIVKNAFPSYHSAFEEVMSSSSPLMRDCIFIMKDLYFIMVI